MKSNYYVYNNEAIACCILLEVLRKTEKLDYPRFFLILPLLMDDQNINLLNNDKEIDIEVFFKNNNKFKNFNSRFLSLAPVTVNSLIILTEMGLINLDKQKNVFLVDDGCSNFSSSERLMRIKKVIPLLLNMVMNFSTEYLYVNLGVEL